MHQMRNMDDKEEGELVESDDEMNQNEGTKPPEEVPRFGAYGGVVQRRAFADAGMYRTSRHAESSSDEDNSDDEDSFLWNRKKMRYKGSATSDGNGVFINPLLQKKQRETSESEVSDSCQSPVKSGLPAQNVKTSDAMGASTGGAKPKRKRNNVWGSVMTEQTLSHTMGGFDVNIPLQEKAEFVEDRNVENYDFTLKSQDERPDPVAFDDQDMSEKGADNEEPPQDICDKETFGKEDEQKREERMKRKRKIKDRLGDRPGDQEENRLSVKERLGKRSIKDRLGEKIPVIVEKPEGYIDVTEEDSDAKVVNALVENLKEPKVKLMANIVEVLGKKNAIDLMHETEMIEAQGGMMTNDNSRRRTPGGVFLQLLRYDSGLSNEQVKKIFEEERVVENRARKKRAAVYRRKRMEEAKRRQGDVNFLESIQEYQSVKEQLKEDETIDKILNNEDVIVDCKKSEVDETNGHKMKVEFLVDDELGEVPDIEIGDM